MPFQHISIVLNKTNQLWCLRYDGSLCTKCVSVHKRRLPVRADHVPIKISHLPPRTLTPSSNTHNNQRVTAGTITN